MLDRGQVQHSVLFPVLCVALRAPIADSYIGVTKAQALRLISAPALVALSFHFRQVNIAYWLMQFSIVRLFVLTVICAGYALIARSLGPRLTVFLVTPLFSYSVGRTLDCRPRFAVLISGALALLALTGLEFETGAILFWGLQWISILAFCMFLNPPGR